METKLCKCGCNKEFVRPGTMSTATWKQTKFHPECRGNAYKVKRTGETKPCLCGCGEPVYRLKWENEEHWMTHNFASKQCRNIWSRGKTRKEALVEEYKASIKYTAKKSLEEAVLPEPTEDIKKALYERMMRGACR